MESNQFIAINACTRTIKAGELVYLAGTFTHPDDGTKTPCVIPAGELTAEKLKVLEQPNGTFEITYPFTWER